MLPSIPLVPRRPKSGEPGTGKGKDKKGDKKKDKSADLDKPDTPVPPSDPDEKVSKDHYTVKREKRVELKKIDKQAHLKKLAFIPRQLLIRGISRERESQDRSTFFTFHVAVFVASEHRRICGCFFIRSSSILTILLPVLVY